MPTRLDDVRLVRWRTRAVDATSDLDPLVVLVVVLGAVLRIQLAAASPYFPDESDGYLPLASSISFSGDSLNLPLRGRNHPALVGYVIRLSQALFGSSPLGTRLLHVLMATASIAIAAAMTRQWYGVGIARWTASLLAFNEYGLRTGSLATSHAPQWLFLTVAIYGFQRFLATERPALLYVTALGAALAFLCREHAVLILPVLLVTLVWNTGTRWLRSRHVWLALVGYLLVVAPDIAWNVTAGEGVSQATYADHLQRVGGIGLSPYPLAFYARDVVTWLHPLITGRPFGDPLLEYESLNAALGVALLVLTVACLARSHDRRTPLSRLLTVLLVAYFGVFSLIRPGTPERNLDPASWAWIDISLLATSVLASAGLAGFSRRWRVTVGTALAAGLTVSVARLLW